MLSTKIQVLTPSFYWKQDTSRRAYIALKLIKRDGAISSAEFGISRRRHGTRTYRNLTAASLQRAASLYPFGIRGFRPSAEARELARAEAFQNEFGHARERRSVADALAYGKACEEAAQ